MSLRVLIVDDEALARRRLRTLLGDLAQQHPGWPPLEVGEAEQAVAAMRQLQHQPWDLCLLDIHMPGLDGIGLARVVAALPQPPALVFVTAHAEHALQAFEVNALDYLTKPVRRERLAQAIDKALARRHTQTRAPAPESAAPLDALLIHERGRTERVPLAEVLYLKAELKYITVRTASGRTLLYDGSLNELEPRLGPGWLRVHRNALVARHALRALERAHDPEEGEGWAVRLQSVDELLAVSRRQLPLVREALKP